MFSINPYQPPKAEEHCRCKTCQTLRKAALYEEFYSLLEQKPQSYGSVFKPLGEIERLEIICEFLTELHANTEIATTAKYSVLNQLSEYLEKRGLHPRIA